MVCIKNEIDILKSMDHPNIVKMVDSYDEPKHFYIVMEFQDGGDVSSSFRVYNFSFLAVEKNANETAF